MLHFFRKLRIRHKILFLSVLLILISSITMLFSFRYLSIALTEKTMNTRATTMNAIVAEMDRFFAELDMQAFTTCSNADLQRFVSRYPDLNSYERQRTYAAIMQIIAQISIPRDYVKVHLFSDHLPGQLIAEFLSRRISPDHNFHEDNWFQVLSAETEKNRVIIPGGAQEYYQPSERGNVVTCAYRILSRSTLSVIGYLVIDIDQSYFDNFFAQSSSDDSAQVYLYASEDQLVYSTSDNSKLDIESLRGQLTPIEQPGQSGQAMVRLGRSDYLVAFGQSRATGWIYYSLVSADSLLHDIRVISYVFSIGFALTILLAILLSLGLARTITTPLETLIAQMKVAQKGHLPLPVSVTVDSHDESGQLIRQYNDMMVEIKDLMLRNQNMAILKKEAEYNALQQQINPHFMYNTLEIMIGLACEQDTEGVIKISKNLGRMLTYNLDHRKYVTVKDEIRHVANYIGIIQNRWHERFKAYYQIDPQAADCYILKFIIQPLVENAIIHGFADMTHDGKLTISVQKMTRSIELTVEDNGKGMDEQTLERLLNITQDYQIDRDKKIGVSNVLNRLALNYGEAAAYDIQSKPGQGTKIILRFPAMSTVADDQSTWFVHDEPEIERKSLPAEDVF